MKRARYQAEFKAEAVKQVTDRGHGVVEVAKRLGISDKSLYLCGCPKNSKALAAVRRRPSTAVLLRILRNHIREAEALRRRSGAEQAAIQAKTLPQI